MNELDTLRNQLAQAIAGYRVAERQANRSLQVLSSNLHNLAAQAGLYRLADQIAGRTRPSLAERVAYATQRVNNGIQLPA